MTARHVLLAATLLLAPAAASAQSTWQPSPAPLVTADNEPWFRAGVPIIWSADYYYPAGTPRFFSPNEMVRSGSFHGIPLYTDPTLDPYSIVYVPIAGGLMQPYERRRDGALAGTTGSTTPAFPPAAATEMARLPEAAGVAEMYEVLQAHEPSGHARRSEAQRGVQAPSRETPLPTTPGTRAANRVWITYAGHRWFARGEAMSLGENHFRQIGTYHGFPVYRLDGDTSRIYIPGTDSLVTAFSLRQR